MNQPLLEVENLTVRYGGGAAVRAVDLYLRQGELVALVGANGAGKTSTLHAIMGLVSYTGTVRFGGTDLSNSSTEQTVQRGLTLTPEGRHIFGGLTVSENLRVSGWGLSRDERRKRIDRITDVFPILHDRAKQAAATLSGGEQQQLAIARSLMSNPRLLMLDEPSLGLAPILTEVIVQAIQDLKDRGLTILVVEQRVEQFLDGADRCYTLVRGEIDAHGEPRRLRESGAVERAYLGLKATETAN